MAELVVTSQMAGNKVKRYTVHPFWISHNSKFGDQLKSKIDHVHSESQRLESNSTLSIFFSLETFGHHTTF